MLALNFPDLKTFTSHLFIKDTFDSFLLCEASITTDNTFTINGRLHRNFFDNDEWEVITEKEYSRWASIKPICFELIKGKKLPLHFSITMKLSSVNTARFLRQTELKLSPEELGGLFLHIRYEKGILIASTGISLTVFTMDKMPENAWDEMVKRFFRQKKIVFEE